tara:strand:- start:1936 stop:2178 length:243 start_codon:yes stop_codon:yes gene_type:complete
MIKLEAYRTRDGIVHDTYAKAQKAADKAYGDQLTKMAHHLVRIDKYSDMTKALDGYKGSMRRLLDLADDLVVCNDEGTSE